MCGYFTHGLAGGARLRERVFHSQTIAEIFAQIDEYFAAMIEHGLPPDHHALTAGGGFVDRGPRDPKCGEVTNAAPAAGRRGQRRLEFRLPAECAGCDLVPPKAEHPR